MAYNGDPQQDWMRLNSVITDAGPLYLPPPIARPEEPFVAKNFVGAVGCPIRFLPDDGAAVDLPATAIRPILDDAQLKAVLVCGFLDIACYRDLPPGRRGHLTLTVSGDSPIVHDYGPLRVGTHYPEIEGIDFAVGDVIVFEPIPQAEGR